jgi:hypothetical protein
MGQTEMREGELRKHAVCTLCGKKVMHTGLPLFYRVTAERFGIDLQAAKRQDGLAQFLGGHVGLAQIMGPDEVMSKAVMEPAVATACEACSTEPHCVAELAERGEKVTK